MKHTNYSSAKTLQDVYDIQHHICDDGEGPTWHRNMALMECAKDSESIMELGINQGSSFVLMMMQNPKKIIGVDVNTNSWFKGGLYELASEYATNNNIEVEILKMSSTDPKSIRNVDMLHIDSLHNPKHLKGELKLHAPHVNKYIAFHDIKQNNYELWKVIQEFLANNKDWKLKNFYDKEGKCGHVEIEKIK